MTDTSLPETWRRYKSLRENWKILEDSNQDSSLKAKVSGLIATFLPRYALHKNEMLEWVAKMRYEESIQTDYYCDQVTLPLFLDGGDISWATALAPYSNEVLETLATAPSPYRLDFTRRCLSHTYVESVKTLLAISLYQKSHHSLPNSLTELVPTYLDSLPVDYFDGGTRPAFRTRPCHSPLTHRPRPSPPTDAPRGAYNKRLFF